MSELSLEADMPADPQRVGFVPKADSCTAANSVEFRPVSYAARSMRLSISMRSIPKSIGLVKHLRAILKRPTLGLRIAVGSDHDDRNIRSSGLCLGKESQGRSCFCATKVSQV
jgi:hypothetical protein